MSKACVRVLHVLYTDPTRRDGYGVRSRYLLEHLAACDAELRVAVSPFQRRSPSADRLRDSAQRLDVLHPADRRAPLGAGDRCRRAFSRYLNRVTRRLGPAEVAAPGTPARRPLPKRLAGRALGFAARFEERLLLAQFRRQLERFAGASGVHLLHAHSPYRCALPALAAGQTHGLPVLYEVRGIWEESAVANGRFRRDSADYRRWHRRETRAMLAADGVLCISEALAREAIARGVAPERVFVVPNGVDTDHFDPRRAVRPNAALERARERLRPWTLGYIGTLRPLEGVADLLHALASLVGSGRDVGALIVGDGPEKARLEDLARQLGVADRTVFAGPVAHEDTPGWYRLIDVFVVPRADAPVCRTVTPLKPLEAMAMERAVIASDLPALREMISPATTGLLYPSGEVADLTATCATMLEDDEQRRRLGRAARRWVVKHRQWKKITADLMGIYETTLRRASSAPSTAARPATP